MEATPAAQLEDEAVASKVTGDVTALLFDGAETDTPDDAFAENVTGVFAAPPQLSHS
jgi:hypothetical protein